MGNKVLVLLLIAINLASFQRMSAQDFVLANESLFNNGSVVHGSYLTNEWYDNWHFGFAGGVSTSFSKVNTPRISPMFDFTVLKWFTPSIGIRAGYQGQWGREYLTIPYSPYANNHSALPFDHNFGENGTLSYGMYYIHGDFMINVTNIIIGYDQKRKWNASPYFNAGLLNMYDNKGGDGSDREIGFGLGLYSTCHLADRWLLTADLRHTNIASRYKTNDGVRTNFLGLTVGVAYNIKRNYFRRAQEVIAEYSDNKAEAAVLAANQVIEKQQKQVRDLEQQVVQQRIVIDESEKVLEMTVQDLKLRAAGANQVLFFTINKAQLSITEMQHLRNYVRMQLDAQPDHIFYLTGSSDKGTGSLDYNVRLSRERAYAIRDILQNEFDVNPENIVIKATVVSDKDPDGILDRCVLIESETDNYHMYTSK